MRTVATSLAWTRATLWACLALSGCTYVFEDSMKQWVGEPLSEFQHKHKNDSDLINTQSDPASGLTVYAYRLTYLNSCTVYWTVNGHGTIVAWRHEGRDCHGVWP